MTGTTLSGRIVVVAGGTGNVGEGVVRGLLVQGATVVVPSRSAERLDGLRGLLGEPQNRLVTLDAAYDDFASAEALAARVVDQVGRVDDVVASIGGWWAGKNLWEVEESDWQQVFVGPATTHLALARAFVPRLPDGGSYTTIAGFSSLQAYPGSGLVSMQGAAQLMMRQTLAAEVNGRIRVNELMLGPIINRSRTRGHKTWLSADQVGLVVAHVIADPALVGERLDVQDLDRARRFVPELAASAL